MIFSKYASPDFLLNQMISSGRLFEFVIEFIDIQNEEKEYEYWLHKVWDKSFEEFKRLINKPKEEMPEEKLETTISMSQNILANFKPE